MGVFVGLRVDPDHVSAGAWQSVYADSRRILAEWSRAPLGIGWRTVAGVKVTALTRCVDNPIDPSEGWRVIGDAVSRRHAETFDFPRVLRGAEDPATPRRDILVEYVTTADAPTVFNSKTQGEPYHTLMVAVATLVENRFPGIALATGDLSEADGDAACSELTRIFGEPFQPPVMSDRARMRERLLPVLGAEECDRAIQQWAPPGGGAIIADLLGLLRRRDPIPFELDSAVGCTDVTSLSPQTRELLASFGAGTYARAVRFEITGREGGTRFERKKLLRIIATGTNCECCYLTDFAWDDVEAADDETLRLFAVVATIPNHDLYLHQLVCAVFESRAIREFLLARWRECGARF